MDQCVTLRVEQGKTRSMKTGRGARQGCSLPPILFYLYSEYFIKETLESSGNLKIGLLICTVKCADDLVLLAKEEMLFHGMIQKLTETGRCYGMEMDVEKTKVMRISRQSSILQTVIDQNNWRTQTTSTIWVA
jgi:hypothetical protein